MRQLMDMTKPLLLSFGVVFATAPFIGVALSMVLAVVIGLAISIPAIWKKHPLDRLPDDL